MLIVYMVSAVHDTLDECVISACWSLKGHGAEIKFIVAEGHGSTMVILKPSVAKFG